MQENTTPSCVGITDEGVYVGKPAIAQQEENVANTYFEVKRVIGQKYESIQKNTKFWPFTLMENENGKAMYGLSIGSEQKLLHPEEISAVVLNI